MTQIYADSFLGVIKNHNYILKKSAQIRVICVIRVPIK